MMKQYQNPVAYFLLLAKEDIMTASSGVGTVVDFSEGTEVDPGM